MYAEAIAMAGLVAAANAMPGAPPAYSGSWESTSTPVTSGAVYSSTPVWSASTPVSPPAYSSSAVVSSAPVPSGSAYPSCWSACFQAAGISSEAALCGNTQVDACIQSSCSSAEDQAYWAWYESYCPATTTPVTPTGPVTTTTPVVWTTTPVVWTTTPATPTGPIPTATYPACWSSCFAANDVTSEAQLCGDDAVSQCIYETCDSADDQAYWAWYEGYCTGPATVTTVITLTSPCVSTGTTTWASTNWTPAGPPTTGPASPVTTATWGASTATGNTGVWGATTTASTATGTSPWGAAQTTSNGWPPVAATGGASVVAKSGFALLAGFLGLVALL